ncbi:hypothetical protein RD792_012445 [Penstemon davidsonii]|uniref:RST domain-containing protein n=1 Tax=Penstemon davidsonii TaxID=160366 RepID=A0ABR0CXN1_9LAMI|nr:hypothetical protein RD792_012445 [Penstemon davidsonii]
MDPNIMKFLEEDEDETMHSGADVDAFTAELNRDIEGNSSTSQHPSDSESAALSQGSSQAASQFLPQWQTSGHDGVVNFQSGQDFMFAEQKDQYPSQMEQQQHDTDSLNPKEDGSSDVFNPFRHNPSVDTCPDPQKDDQNTFTASQPVSEQTSAEQLVPTQKPDHEPKSGGGSKLQKFQNTSGQQSTAIGSNEYQPMATELNDQQLFSTGKENQQTSMGFSNDQATATLNQHSAGAGMNSQQALTSGMNNQQAGTSLKLNKQVPFGMLLPIIQPQLDKDRAMQLHTLYFKLKKNEISKDGFVRHMRSIVGDHMLKMAVYKLQNQILKTVVSTSAELTNPTSESSTGKPREVDNQGDPQAVQVGQMSTSSLSQERKHPVPMTQGLNKQQHMHFPQTSFPTYGSAGSSYSPFSTTNVASSTSLRPQPHDLHMRLASTHQNMTSSHLGPTAHAMNTKKMQAGTPTHTNSNTAMQQNSVQWPSSTSKEQNIGVSSSMNYVKQEPVDQPGNMEDEFFEMHSSRLGFMPPTSMSNTRMPSLPSSIGPSKAPPKKPLVSQKKPMEVPGSSPPPSSKKQKVSGGFLDQSIEQLNDVTAVSGVNLREEEEQLFSGSKEDSRVSEASRRVVQEEEERLILHKIPLQKKVVEIMAKSGLKSMSNDVERCLSLCVEERMRGLIANLIRLSKQRVDIEKPRHRTIITSDIRQQIMTINRKAHEEWEKKQAETEKSQKQIDPESGAGVDGDKEKDETRSKSVKANKEEDDKMRTTAANVAVRAATGVGDMLSRWQLMIEAKQKQGGSDTSSGFQLGKDVARKPLQTSTKNTRENQEPDKRDPAAAFNTPASIRKVGRNQVVMPGVARSITVKDVIAILEREPQMSKSTLIYRLYDKIRTDVASE